MKQYFSLCKTAELRQIRFFSTSFYSQILACVVEWAVAEIADCKGLVLVRHHVAGVVGLFVSFAMDGRAALICGAMGTYAFVKTKGGWSILI